MEKLDLFKTKLNEVADISAAMALLGWDQQTYMPRGGAQDRGDIFSTMAGLLHEKATSPEAIALLEEMKELAKSMDPDSDDARLIKVTAKAMDKQLKLPKRYVEEFAMATTVAQTEWEHAKHENNFALYQPHLEKVVELRREYASYFQPYEHVYDPLLDDFEPGLKTAEVIAIFDELRPRQVELIKAITAAKQVDDSFLKLEYDPDVQWEFGKEVVTAMGYDFNRGRIDQVEHPFTTGFGIDDVRITTHVYPKMVTSALFSTIHEGGHALYEQGIDHKYRRTPLATGASMALHESQSRMWENLVGRSLGFWKFFYPKLQAKFPTQLGNVSMEQFYKAVNKVSPSFIRTEADEATYNLHIMLRLELEIALMEGTLAVKDLPEAWNTRMKDYLGVVPPNDTKGVLQDVHWSSGMIGYFPTYALGNLVSVQLWEVIQRQIPDLDSQIANGKFDGLLGWLRENVHKTGAKFEPQEMVQKITGSKINPQPYLRYLTNKYSSIYGL